MKKYLLMSVTLHILLLFAGFSHANMTKEKLHEKQTEDKKGGGVASE